MYLSIKKVISSNLIIKIVSLLLGYSFWIFLGQSMPITRSFIVPLVYENADSSTTMHGPEMITVELHATRSRLNALDYNNLAVHIDAQELQEGNNPLIITPDMLFLPYAINVVNYRPSNITINMSKK